jgi:hypothetical protein
MGRKPASDTLCVTMNAREVGTLVCLDQRRR